MKKLLQFGFFYGRRGSNFLKQTFFYILDFQYINHWKL